MKNFLRDKSLEITAGVLLVLGLGLVLFVGKGFLGGSGSSDEMMEKLKAPSVRNDLVSKIRAANKEGFDNYIKEGLDLNQQLGSNGQTLLIIAAQSGNLESVKMLLEKGADPKLKDYTGLTAEAAAKVKGFHNIADYIREHSK